MGLSHGLLWDAKLGFIAESLDIIKSCFYNVRSYPIVA